MVLLLLLTMIILTKCQLEANAQTAHIQFSHTQRATDRLTHTTLGEAPVLPVYIFIKSWPAVKRAAAGTSHQ